MSDPLFPDESQIFTASTIRGCRDIGDRVIIETAKNTVEGVISYSLNGRFKVQYDAVSAGWTTGYELGPCEIKSIRCFTCCDDRYYQAADCSPLTKDLVDALIGPDAPVGQLYIYSGDLSNPSCLWKYKGLGSHLEPAAWVDVFGDTSDQIIQMSEDQVSQFVDWLADIFQGNGVSFNPDLENGKIVVTASGDGESATSFTISYQNGNVVMDAGDSSTPKTVQFIKVDGLPPHKPYNWFLYVDQSSGQAYLNIGGEAMLLGTLEHDELATCEGVASCLRDGLLNPPAPDQYAMPEVLDFVINQVVYFDGATKVVEYTTCTTGSSDLDDLVANLNACGVNPSGWLWRNVSGVLTLCVSSNTAIQTVIHGGASIINFNGIPTVAGGEGVDLCAAVVECARNSGIGMTATDFDQEVLVESLHVGQQYATVRWTDTNGTPRISYKDPVHGWYHPSDHHTSSNIGSVSVRNSTGGNTFTTDVLYNFRTSQGVPDAARRIHLRIRAGGQLTAIGGYANGYARADVAVAVTDSLAIAQPYTWAQGSAFLPVLANAGAENSYSLGGPFADVRDITLNITPADETIRCYLNAFMNPTDYLVSYPDLDFRVYSSIQFLGWSL